MTALTRCAVALFVLVSTRLSLPCSFAVGNYNMTDPPERWAHANAYNRRRGPDATHVVSLQGWVFLHNLLSMTGALTYQPFVSPDGHVACVFNGEIYNYRKLAEMLAGDATAYPSDGYALLPAFAKWGPEFVQHLEGEVCACQAHVIPVLLGTGCCLRPAGLVA